ncbi:MAG: L,D-transpeptidase family protein [Chloroflexota bacterium]
MASESGVAGRDEGLLFVARLHSVDLRSERVGGVMESQCGSGTGANAARLQAISARLASAAMKLDKRSSTAAGQRILVLLSAVVLAVALAVPALAQTTTPATSPDQAANATWAVTLGPAALRGQPNDSTDQFTELRPGSPLQILTQEGDWTYVYNPRAKGTAYVHSDLLGPSDPPSAYVYKEPPADQEDVGQPGYVVADTTLSVYPSPSADAALTEIDAGALVEVAASVQGEDGAEWYRTDDGNYLPNDTVSFAQVTPGSTAAAAPSTPPQTFSGRWMDVDLNEPARLTAYEGNSVVRSMLVIKGRIPRPTPVGVFAIIRRVANETMDSSTIGIPRNGPGGYYLKNVLFTQYFTNDGASLHYNYWSSNFGYAGSHGCLGLSYQDSAWLWNWATIGSSLSIHY